MRNALEEEELHGYLSNILPERASAQENLNYCSALLQHNRSELLDATRRVV